MQKGGIFVHFGMVVWELFPNMSSSAGAPQYAQMFIMDKSPEQQKQNICSESILSQFSRKLICLKG